MSDRPHPMKDANATDPRHGNNPDPAGTPAAGTDPAALPPPDDRIAAVLLFLLVQATTRGACMHQMQSIGQHLRMLADERSASALLRETCAKLHAHWAKCLASVETERADTPMTIERTAIERSVH